MICNVFCIVVLSTSIDYWQIQTGSLKWLDDLLRDWAKGTAAPWRSWNNESGRPWKQSPRWMLGAKPEETCQFCGISTCAAHGIEHTAACPSKMSLQEIWAPNYDYALRSCKAMDCTWLLKLSRLRSAAWYLALASAEQKYQSLHQELEAQDAFVPNAFWGAMPEQRPAATPVPHRNQFSTTQSRA